jgi:LCP family protein required for cell wall assembly
VLLALIAYPVALFVVAWTSLGRVDALGGSDSAGTPGRTYLVVGSDSRETLTPEERKRLSTGRIAGRRTDTIMLLHVPSGGGPTVLVSIPRDSYVAIPGHGSSKVNAAYAFGGPALLVRTLEQATGLVIDEYVETGLGGFADVVDAIGGVRICPKRAMKDAHADLNIKSGCQDVDGTTALGYARARYSDPLGDLGRVQRQREVLSAIAGKTLSPAVIALPWRSFPAARAGGGALTVDQSTSPTALARFVLAMRSVAGGGGVSLTVPVARADYRTSAGLCVLWDERAADRLFAALRQDDTEAVRPIAKEQARLLGR